MTAKVDLEKLKEVCPELHEVFAGKGLTIELDVFAIAATMLKLAGENEKMKTLIGDIANNRTDDPIDAAREFFMPKMAARKGDEDE